LTNIDEPLYYGEQSEQIEALQGALFYLGYLEDQIDGIFGLLTETALLEAQRAFGFEETPALSLELLETMTEKAKNENNIEEQAGTETSKQEPEPIKRNQASAIIESVIKEAKGQTGVRYQWGGESPKGFDCSGFIQFIF